MIKGKKLPDTWFEVEIYGPKGFTKDANKFSDRAEIEPFMKKNHPDVELYSLVKVELTRTIINTVRID